ncbi:MAG: DUF2184 domain-containing protein [Elusimicrobia bacterium]|nr:DUF2184 domain-containing protein [Elusimicrobiota bacterium]
MFTRKMLENAVAAIKANPIQYQPGLQIAFNANGDVDPASTGFKFQTQTTTLIRAKVMEQKFMKIKPSEFMGVNVGEGAWMGEIKTNRVFTVAGDFESAIVGTAEGAIGIPQVGAKTAPVSVAIATVNVGYEYTIPEVNQAMASLNWDPVESKIKGTKEFWDLGIQKIAFLGRLSDPDNFEGLLTSSDVNVVSDFMPCMIKDMTTTQLQTLVSSILALFYENSNRTAQPGNNAMANTLAIPMEDWLGLDRPWSKDFPNISIREYLEKAFKMATLDQSFKIIGLPYCDQAVNAGYVSVAGANRYILYRNDGETVSMNIPVDLMILAPNTGDNYKFNGVAVGQFSGSKFYRPAQALYLDYVPAA